MATVFAFVIPQLQAQRRLQSVSASTPVVDGKTVVTAAPSGCKANVFGMSDNAKKGKAWSDNGTSVATVLVDEDFSRFTKGNMDEPSDELVAYYYGAPGQNIDPSLTQAPGWTGTNVYQAGGMALVKEASVTSGGCINTPLGDYSGDLTITFRYKIAKGYDGHGEVFVNVLKGGIDGPVAANCTNNFNKFDVYAGQDEWQEVTLRCTNTSADNDGFVQFTVYGQVLLDDIKITNTQNFIANPVLLPPSAFTETSFTANWQRVRLAYGYQVRLMKKVFTSDETTKNYTFDFEDGNAVPDGWTVTGDTEGRIVDGEGNNGSKGLKLQNNDTIITPFNLSKYKNLKLYGRLVLPEGVTPDQIKGTVHFRLRTFDGWKDVQGVSAGWFYDPWNLDFGQELASFDGNYYGISMSVEGLNEGAYIVVDDFEFATGRPAELQDVIGWDDYEYTEGRDTHYTFTGLDPEGDYFYAVKAQYQDLYSTGVTGHALGLAAPAVKPATDIDEAGGYTANWGLSTKAMQYVVTNYGVETVAEDEKNRVILDEDFSKVDASKTDAETPDQATALANYEVTSLDEYTKMPGWLGLGNTLAQGWVGAEESATYLYFVRTPQLYLSNSDNFVLRLKATGVAGERLIVFVNGKGYLIPFDTANIDGEFVIPEHGDNLTVQFHTQNGMAFCLDRVTILQDVKKGQSVYTFLGDAETDAKTLSHRFEGIAEGYPKYAYNVYAKYEVEGEAASSDRNAYTIVDLKAGTSTGISSVEGGSGKGVSTIACYDIYGRKLPKLQRGVNVIKYSDGTTRKVVVR